MTDPPDGGNRPAAAAAMRAFASRDEVERTATVFSLPLWAR